VSSESALTGDRGRDTVLRRGKGEEECVPLRVDLLATGSLACLAQEPLMLS